jgi:hypothetical protein
VINYGLKFSGVVVTIIGRECVPINCPCRKFHPVGISRRIG